MFTEKTPEERATLDIKSAMDSVNLINKLVSAGTHSDEIDKRVQANYQHLEIVLKRDHVINNSSADLKPLSDAVVSGKAFAPKAD